MLHEVVEGDERLLTRHRPIECSRRAVMVAEVRFDVGRHLARDRIGLERRRRGHYARALPTEGAAVLFVEIPAPAFGLAVRIHQHLVLRSHMAVEGLHHQPLFAACEIGELDARGHEMKVVSHHEPHAGARAGRGDELLESPFARLGHDDRLRAMAQQAVAECRADRCEFMCAQLEIVERHATTGHCLGEVAHGREEDRGAHLRARDVIRLVRHLGHPDAIARRVEAFEGNAGQAQLIAERQHQVSHGCLAAHTYRFWQFSQ